MSLNRGKILQNITAGGSTDAEFTEQVGLALTCKDNNENTTTRYLSFVGLWESGL
jgi:hypothetical protein